MATFEAPNYVIGNSSTITAQLSSVLTTLDQALQALQPAPNSTTVQFNDTLVLNDGSTVDTTNISPTELLITDGIYNGRINKDVMSFDNNVDGLAIYIEPTVPRIYLTDGTTTNTIDKNGYTTRNTSANLTHYLDFSDNSATGTGAIQKTTGIECNPSTKTITATTFSGNATTSTTASTSTNSNISLVSTGVYYPTFSTNTSGSQALLASAGLSFNATSSTLTTTNFSGNASTATTSTNATNVGITSDNTSGTYYLPFVKTSGTGNKPLFIDDGTTALTYNPSTATLNLNTTASSANASLTLTDTSTSTGMALKLVNYSSTDYIQFTPLTSNAVSLTFGGVVPTTPNNWTSITFISNGNHTFTSGGNNQSIIGLTGVQETLLTTQGTAIFSATTLTLVSTGSAPYPTSYANIITFSGSTVAQTITAITVPTNMPVNGMYYCYMTNSNTSAGAITVNATGLGTGIKTTYTSNVVIPISGFALATLTKVGSAVYIFSINLVA